MKKFIVILLVLVFFCCGRAWAEVVIKAEVDKLALSTDEELVYKVNVISGMKNTPAPQLPDFKGFKAISQAQSTTLSFQKGQSEALMTYVYILVPVNTGKLTIESSSLKLKEQVLVTQSFEILVTQGKNAPAVRPEEIPQDAPGALEATL